MKRENYLFRYIKGAVIRSELGKYLRFKIRSKKGKYIPKDTSIDEIFPNVAKISVDLSIHTVPKIGIHNTSNEYKQYIGISDRLLRYKRFLDINNVSYKVIDLFRSDWLEQCEDLDIIVASYTSEPSRLREFESKIYILEKFYGKICYPASKDLWSYEDKVRLNYLVKEYGAPHVETFISNDYEESLKYVETAKYPFVSKVRTGSCSRGVELIRNKKEAKRIVNKNFSIGGRRALWTYCFEKDYVYFQDFIEDATYDLRIFIVGDVILGYKRRMKGDDFRASGAGLLDRSLFPEDALKIALDLKEKWDTTFLAVDFVDTNNSKEHLVIEASISIGLDYPEYLEDNGKHIFYVKDGDTIKTMEGELWSQDFILVELINQWINRQKEKAGEDPIRLKWKLG